MSGDREPPNASGADQIAHDVNNLLSAIAAASDAVLSRAVIDPETRADLVLIRVSARRAGTKLRRLLRHGAQRDEPPSLHPRCIDLVIQEIANTIRHVAGPAIRLEIDLGTPDRLALLDVDALHDALLNLVANARDAMPDGGVVTLRTELAALRQPMAAAPDAVPAGHYVCIELSDHGPGLAPDLWSKVFEPYVTTKGSNHGGGLGLPAVKEVMRRHAGAVTLDSRPGGGTRVRMFVPVLSKSRRQPDGRLILLVEDEPALCRLMVQALSGQGWRVAAAASGEALLRLPLLAAPSAETPSAETPSAETPALLISDLALAGLDGLALLHGVRRIFPDLPAILLSGYGRAYLPTGSPGVAFLHKPFGMAELSELVASVADQGIGESDGFFYCSNPAGAGSNMRPTND
ncbi:MAG TPA: ATP-binding protein [Acetobacteraceae bacterium]